MENNRIYTDNEQIKGIIRFFIILFFGIYIFQNHILEGIIILIFDFIVLVTTLSLSSGLILFDDKIIIKYFNTMREISFSKIKRIYQIKRPDGWFYFWRTHLVIEYSESSGYGDEISYIFDQKMYDDINEKYTAYKSAMNKF
jgi:hypothetical protein